VEGGVRQQRDGGSELIKATCASVSVARVEHRLADRRLIVTGPLLTAIMSAGTVLGVGMLILLMIRDYRSLEELSS
jgi:hypothetical protein